jgi:hypothetical protein
MWLYVIPKQYFSARVDRYGNKIVFVKVVGKLRESCRRERNKETTTFKSTSAAF